MARSRKNAGHWKIHHAALGTLLSLAAVFATAGCKPVRDPVHGSQAPTPERVSTLDRVPTPDRVRAPDRVPTLARLWYTKLSTRRFTWWDGRPAVDGGRVFVADYNQIAALDATTGALLWERPVRIFQAISTAPVANGGVLYWSDVDSVLAVDATNGHTIWTFHPDSQAVVVPALDATRLYTGQRGLPVVYALARANGALAWKVNVGAGWPFPGYVGGLALSGDTLYVTASRDDGFNGSPSSGVLVALDRQDGHELWRRDLTGYHSFVDEPLVSGAMVVVNDLRGHGLVGYDRFAPREAWQALGDPGGRGPGHSSSITTSGVFTGLTDGAALGLDAASGRILWRVGGGGAGTGAIGTAICRGQLFMSTGQIQRRDLETGNLTGQFGRLGDVTSGIATDGSVIYFTGPDGVYAARC